MAGDARRKNEGGPDEVRVSVSHDGLMDGLESIGGKLNGFVFKGSAQLNGPKNFKQPKEGIIRTQPRPTSLKTVRPGLKTGGSHGIASDGVATWSFGSPSTIGGKAPSESSGGPHAGSDKAGPGGGSNRGRPPDPPPGTVTDQQERNLTKSRRDVPEQEYEESKEMEAE